MRSDIAYLASTLRKRHSEMEFFIPPDADVLSFSGEQKDGPIAQAVLSSITNLPAKARPLSIDRLVRAFCTEQAKDRWSIAPLTALAETMDHRDTLTGLRTHIHQELNFLLLQMQMAFQAEPERGQAYCMSFDLSNLRGMNLALSGADTNDAYGAITPEGAKLTDGFLRLFSHILKREVEKQCVGREQSAFADYYRSAGDEFDVFVYGLDHDQMQTIQQEVIRQIHAVIEAAGLSTIGHPKYPYRGEYNGVGVAGAFREFRTGGEGEATDLYEMRKELDQAIERNKEKATGRNGSGTPKSKLEREDIERAKAAIESAGASLGIDIYARVPPKPFSFMEEVSGEKEGEGFRWRSERYAAAVATIAGTIKDERDKALLGRLWKCVKPVDKVTRCVTEEPRGALMQVLNFLHNHPDASAHLVVFEVYNMAGMNNRLGHDGCDKAIGNFVQQIATENIPAAQVASYHPPGPYIYTIILGKKNDDIMGIIQETCTRVHEYAVRSGLSDLENPRYPGKENRGARFIVGALELGRSYVMHPELPLDAVREQAIRNKNERLCFRGEGIGKPETGIDYQAQPVKLQPSLPGQLVEIRKGLKDVIPATKDTFPPPGNRQGGKWSGKEHPSP